MHRDEFPEDTYLGMNRFTAMWHENLLLQEWTPAVPDVEAKLRTGARVADVGCGSGRALIKLAAAFNASSFTGFDVFGPQIGAARANAAGAGLAEIVRFEQADAFGRIGVGDGGCGAVRGC